MHKYEMIIYWSAEDDAFIAEVPELPGCVSGGVKLVGKRRCEFPC